VAAHEAALRDHGGGLEGIRSEAAIDSGVNRPYSGYHRSIQRKATALVHSMAGGNHGFTDGNKRTTLLLLGLMLDRSGYKLADDGTPETVAAVEAMLKSVAKGQGARTWGSRGRFWTSTDRRRTKAQHRGCCASYLVPAPPVSAAGLKRLLSSLKRCEDAHCHADKSNSKRREVLRIFLSVLCSVIHSPKLVRGHPSGNAVHFKRRQFLFVMQIIDDQHVSSPSLVSTEIGTH
jgi:death on curing protein